MAKYEAAEAAWGEERTALTARLDAASAQYAELTRQRETEREERLEAQRQSSAASDEQARMRQEQAVAHAESSGLEQRLELEKRQLTQRLEEIESRLNLTDLKLEETTVQRDTAHNVRAS